MEYSFIIDSHEDLAYESLYGGFDYTRSAAENRRNYQGPEKFGTTIGWPELRKARAAVVFGTVFLSPEDHSAGQIDRQTTYFDPEGFHAGVLAQLDFYDRLCGETPEQFVRLFSREDLDRHLRRYLDPQTDTLPVGLIGLLEGCEYLRSFEDLELYQQRGIRLAGPVWAGGRWCAGTRSRDIQDALTEDGRQLLRKMEALGLVLDISHMKNRSAMDALGYYDGIAVATHVNCSALLPGIPVERHLNDETIRMLIEHDGVMGVIPFNSFLSVEWFTGKERDRRNVTLDTLADHIDHICQLAGDSLHAAIGTDFDGGFGYPDIPYEMNDIGDLAKLADVLDKRGFRTEDVQNILGRNWQRILERALK